MASNDERSALTRAKLVAAARSHFARDGYAQTSTDAILAAAGVKRGALYHHYRDKADLFEAVCRELAGEVAAVVEQATDGLSDPVEALATGSQAWVDAMSQPEMRRILVFDAPGVLGRARWEAIDRDLSFDLLLGGVTEAISSGAIRFAAGPEALAVLLNGAMNQIALRADDGELPAMKSGLVGILQALRPSERKQ